MYGIPCAVRGDWVTPRLPSAEPVRLAVAIGLVPIPDPLIGVVPVAAWLYVPTPVTAFRASAGKTGGLASLVGVLPLLEEVPADAVS